jgi:hypothetical protein
VNFETKPARDTVLSNQQTGKLNFDTNYITKRFVDWQVTSNLKTRKLNFGTCYKTKQLDAKRGECLL